MADLAMDPLAGYAAHGPDRPAVIEGDEVTTYAALNSEVNRLVNGLAALGVMPGERATWCGPNSRHVLTFMHACRKLGLVAVPVPHRLTADEIDHLLSDSGASLLAVDSEVAGQAVPVAQRIDSLRNIVVFGNARPAGQAAIAWDAVLSDDDTEPPPPKDYGAAMMYTSGTTGRPKGAVRTRSDRTLLATMLRELRFGHEEVHLLTGPLYHSGPNAFALLTHFSGGTVVVLRHFDPAEWVALVTNHGVTSTFAAPVHLKRIMGLPPEALARGRFSSLRSVIVSAAPVPRSLKEQVIATLGDNCLYEVYGSTELGIDTILRPEDQLRKPGSCGRPYGSVEVKVVGDDGSELPPGEPGQLYVRTPLAIDGYSGEVEQMAALFDDEDDPGETGEAGEDRGALSPWMSVGDIAYLDDEGFVYICDRVTDMVISGGANVYPAEVESVLHSHPGVFDAAVFGVPDDEWGERVHAVVQPHPGTRLDVNELESHAARHLAGYKRPRSWEIRDALPRTESGKLLKRLLRDEYWKGRQLPI